MIPIVQEFTKLDKENEVVDITYSINTVKKAIITFDFANNETTVTGDLYNLVGWNNTEEDKIKYNKFIELQKEYAKLILERY